MTQTVDELTDKEVAWLATQLKVASSFVNCYSPGDSGRPLSLAAIDRAYATWISTPDETDLINGIINGTGVALGQFLVDHAGFRWVIATDDQESALAVLALPGSGDVLVYPINFVAKRWERGEVDFFNKSYEQIAETVRSVATRIKPGSKPWWRLW